MGYRLHLMSDSHLEMLKSILWYSPKRQCIIKKAYIYLLILSEYTHISRDILIHSKCKAWLFSVWSQQQAQYSHCFPYVLFLQNSALNHLTLNDFLRFGWQTTDLHNFFIRLLLILQIYCEKHSALNCSVQ